MPSAVIDDKIHAAVLERLRVGQRRNLRVSLAFSKPELFLRSIPATIHIERYAAVYDRIRKRCRRG